MRTLKRRRFFEYKQGMNKKIALLTMAAVMGLSVTACGGGETKETQGDSKAPAESTAQTEAAAEGGEVANKDKPLVSLTVSHPTVQLVSLI